MLLIQCTTVLIRYQCLASSTIDKREGAPGPALKHDIPYVDFSVQISQNTKQVPLLAQPTKKTDHGYGRGDPK
jgi:hypothetical protein